MSSKNSLYKALYVRFSLMNEQHVEILQNLEKDVKYGEKSRNAIVIEALNDYYLRNRISQQWLRQNFVSKEEYDDCIRNIRNEIKMELYQELMKIFAGGVIARNADKSIVPAVMEPAGNKKEQENTEEEDFDIENDSVIMGNVSKWS